MFAHLKRVLFNFPRTANQTWCFAHTINLCAKSILKHFNLPKKDEKDTLDHIANALANLADNIDHNADMGWEKANDNEEEEDHQQYLEAWTNICDSLADNKIKELQLSVQLARSMLAKVCLSL